MLEWLRGQAIAIAALLIAIGGTSYAVVKLEPNSVGKKQLKANSVVSSKVKDDSLLEEDFKAGELPRGATGPAGAQGARGATGPAGATGLTGVAGRSALTTLQPGETVRGLVGGDFHTATAGGDWRVTVNFPIPAASDPSFPYIDGLTMGENCTGTFMNPTAPPDTICVYPDSAVNPSLSPTSHFIGLISRFGFQLGWSPTSTGDTYFSGSYAMTQG